VGRFVAAASRYHVADGVVEFLGGALNALEILAQRSRNSLFDRVLVLCHTVRGQKQSGLPDLVILVGRWRGVNHLGVPVCPIIAYRAYRLGAGGVRWRLVGGRKPGLRQGGIMRGGGDTVSTEVVAS